MVYIKEKVYNAGQSSWRKTYRVSKYTAQITEMVNGVTGSWNLFSSFFCGIDLLSD